MTKLLPDHQLLSNYRIPLAGKKYGNGSILNHYEFDVSLSESEVFWRFCIGDSVDPEEPKVCCRKPLALQDLPNLQYKFSRDLTVKYIYSKSWSSDRISRRDTLLQFTSLWQSDG
jgi:hypothetical protein